ncbi:hypothetical protein HJC23_004553 [Cyclotella cryptica]|uniref:Exostosin GT47 domain-containing protein n=1 Tax=Cyclotella cryptica TaxID=29204 RepID=A0ABD3QBH8_9STRA|eukprot:CCRYP_007302-RA/>CCRYP_007302-RA protein AED:0.16 eAED:0.16 QI:0/-1/0/1/-1/1/1/0/442
MIATCFGIPCRRLRVLSFSFTFLSFILFDRLKEAIRITTVATESALSTSKVDHVARLLETYKGGRYFVYTSENLTLPHIRAMAKDRHSVATWGRKSWRRRFKDYAVGELRFYEALENYTDSYVRTLNISEADFVLVPIPLGAAVFWGYPSDIENAFNHLLYNEPFFWTHREKHVYITNNERLFRHDMIKFFRDCCGFSYEIVTKISAGMLVNDFDPFAFMHYVIKHPDEAWSFQETKPVFRRYWSIGYSHEASDSKYNLTVASYDDWKNKELALFYRTTTGTSLYNSTQYRHALFRKNMTEAEKVLQPSAIGFQVPYFQWFNEISNAKFCLVVRGDNPSSRSFYTAIRVGCVPMVVSNALPHYQPLFPSLVNFDDFAILIDEKDFLSNPSESINHAIRSLSVFDQKRLIHGLELVQQLLVLDHSHSLFAPAFVHETVARLKG